MSPFWPASTCAASASVPAKLVATFQPGFCDSYVLASSVKAPFSEAAASTVSVPPDWVLVAGAELLEELLLELELEPQPAATNSTAASITPSARDRFMVDSPISIPFRSASSQPRTMSAERAS